MVSRRGQEAGDDQLPHAQAGEGRALLREDLRSDPGLGVLLRQVQARPVQGHHLRALRRRGHSGQGAARADGPHRAGRAGHAHLVLQGCAEPPRLPARPGAEGPGEGHLLRRLHDHLRGRRGPAARPAVPRGADHGRADPARAAPGQRHRDPAEEARGRPGRARGGGRQGRRAPQGARVRGPRDEADPRPRRQGDRPDRRGLVAVQGPEGPGPGGRRAALPRDAGPVRPVLPRRHGRPGHPGPARDLRPRRRGARTCARSSAPARARRRPARSSGSRSSPRS